MSTVLLAEDSAVNRELTRAMLEAWGCTVIEATDGYQALARLESERPDLVLMDIRMPGRDGYEVLRIIRQDPRWKTLPVAALTAFAMDGDRERGLRAGFDAYLTKPIDSGALRELLQRYASPQNTAEGRG
jgi:CheY-like chemotaxis protein